MNPHKTIRREIKDLENTLDYSILNRFNAQVDHLNVGSIPGNLFNQLAVNLGVELSEALK